MRMKSVLAAAAVVLVSASTAGAAAAGHASALHSATAPCRATIKSTNWRAVFGHDATLIAAKARMAKLVPLGYKTVKAENRGCNDYAVVLESPEFSKYQVRTAFATEAAKAKLVVSYAQPGSTRPKLGSVNVIFGHRSTLATASALLSRVAQVGWRESDVFYGGPRDWKVVWPNVPGSAADATVQAAQKAGFAVELELVGQ